MDNENQKQTTGIGGYTSAILVSLDTKINTIIEKVKKTTPYTDRLCLIFNDEIFDEDLDDNLVTISDTEKSKISS